ncbi:MAG: hypothetical protein PF447_12385 [Spirochaetaceae bacterium]|jgi:peroxiredoxin|nr:hypothetical protein [Spirochaetaceae bacterium]
MKLNQQLERVSQSVKQKIPQLANIFESDLGNRVAKRFGLAFTLPENLRPYYEEIGVSLSKYNGNHSFKLPVPGTFIVDQQGIIQGLFVDYD